MKVKFLSTEFHKKKNHKGKNIEAFSIAELIIAILLIGATMTGIIAVIYQAFGLIETSKQKEKAVEIAQEQITGMLSIKKDNWYTLVNNTDGNSKFITLNSSNTYILNDCTITPAVCVAQNISGTNYTTTLTINNAYRDSSTLATFQTTPGILDNHFRYVKVQVSWLNFSQINKTYTQDAYIGDWDTYTISQSLFSDFRKGSDFNNTYLAGGSSAFSGISLSTTTASVYATSGTYTSISFDSLSALTNYFNVDITVDTSSSGTSISLVEARATNQLSGATYLNTTAPSWQTWTTLTCATKNNNTSNTILNCVVPNTSTFTNKEFLEYRITLSTTNTANTPLVTSANINYQ